MKVKHCWKWKPLWTGTFECYSAENEKLGNLKMLCDFVLCLISIDNQDIKSIELCEKHNWTGKNWTFFWEIEVLVRSLSSNNEPWTG